MPCCQRKTAPTFDEQVEDAARVISFQRHGNRGHWDRYVVEAREQVLAAVVVSFPGDDSEDAL